MGWGVNFKTDIYLSRQEYNENIFQVKEKIDNLTDNIENIKIKLSMFCAATPKDIVPLEETSIDWISMETQILFTEYEEIIRDRYKLYLYLDYLKEKNNKNENKED